MTPGVILAATDFSEPADEALRQAHERASRASARLVVCHIVTAPVPVNILFPQRNAEALGSGSELERQALRALIEHTCQVTARTPEEFQAVVTSGTPYARIVEQAERAAADLIVVGERGATGLARVVLGSVAERVVRYAHGPVLVARAGPTSGNILVATDLSEPSLPALVAAAREARRPGVRVTALHCVGLPTYFGSESDPGVSAGVSPDRVEAARTEARLQLGKALERCGLEAEPQVATGIPDAAIVSAAEKLRAELVVVGTRGRTGLRRVMLGSVAESVVRHAPCSVLVVRLA